MGPVLYAELLSNIRQISVIATLPTASNASTGITLAKDRKTLIITHDGLSSSLSLPALVAGTVLARPPSGKIEVSWRIPLADQARSNQQVDLTDTAIAPWAAADLSKFTSLSCKCCGTTVVQAGSVQSWRDLPSENWAEMMDFWHCHKPDHKHEGAGANETDLSTKKGYGANNRFVADIHTGLVDLTYFLLNSVDCIVKVNKDDDGLACVSCGICLGGYDSLRSSNKLNKWSLCIQVSADQPAVHKPLSHFVTANLLSQISLQAISKFVLQPATHCASDSDMATLELWVFAPRLVASFSITGQSKPLPISKIFYKSISMADVPKVLDESNLNASVAGITYDMSIITEIQDLLTASTKTLPESAKKFGGYSVGYLERYVSID